MFSFVNIIILSSFLLLSFFTLATSSTLLAVSATTTTTPVTMRVGNFDFGLGSNPGFLTVRASTHTTSSFGAVCSYGLDPVVSGFATEQELNQSQSVADLFCGYAFNFWTPNATHTNFFSSADSIDLGAPPFPFMRNIACGNKVVCDNADVQMADFTNPTIAVAQQRSLFSKCSFEYFEYSYRSSIGGSGGSVPPLKCYQDKYLQLNCMIPRANAPDLTPAPTTSADPAQSTSTATTTTFVDDFVNPVSSTENPIYYAAGIKSGATWKVRINSNFYNRLEVSQDNGASWGLSAPWYKNDTARLLCHQFFNFTSKKAWFAQLPPNSKTSSMSFAWYAAPSCDGCMKLGNLDACTVRPTPPDAPPDFFSSGDEIGLFCNDQPKDKPLVKETDLDTLPTKASGNFEYKHDAGNGGALYARPVVVGAGTANPFAFGPVSATAVSEITAGTLCSWLGYNGSGMARTQEAILANYAESMPRIGVQPCWVSSLLCYSSFAKSADDCSFATNQASMCGGLDGSLFLECNFANATNANGNNNNKNIVITNSDSSVVMSIAIGLGVLVAVVLITLVVTCCFFRRRVFLSMMSKITGYTNDSVEIISENHATNVTNTTKDGRKRNNNNTNNVTFDFNNRNSNNNNSTLHSPRNDDDDEGDVHANNSHVVEMHPVTNNNHRQTMGGNKNNNFVEGGVSSSSSTATVNRHSNNSINKLALENLASPNNTTNSNNAAVTSGAALPVLFPFPKVIGEEINNNNNNTVRDASPEAGNPSQKQRRPHDLAASSSMEGSSMRGGSTTVLISPHSNTSESPMNSHNNHNKKTNNNHDDDNLYDLGSPASTHNLVSRPRQPPPKKQQQTVSGNSGDDDLFAMFAEKVTSKKKDSKYQENTKTKTGKDTNGAEFSDAEKE